jgi:hypothetical protein
MPKKSVEVQLDNATWITIAAYAKAQGRSVRSQLNLWIKEAYASHKQEAYASLNPLEDQGDTSVIPMPMRANTQGTTSAVEPARGEYVDFKDGSRVWVPAAEAGEAGAGSETPSETPSETGSYPWEAKKS